ncbi:MAG TPA: hypothetical protein VD929_01075 [Caulobacteraceae bacterium]|nr:hypothetical protein [Caulobacteraceae bacterium]
MAALKKSAVSARPPRPAALRMRDAIAAARADGLDPAGMVLRMTLRDSSALVRDPAVATDEISFAEGRMWFLGVPVVAGGVVESALDRSGAPVEVPA